MQQRDNLLQLVPSAGLARALLSLLLAGLSGELYAALGGVPEKPVPGRNWPKMWLGIANDDYGPIQDGDDMDDHRTAAFHGGYRHDNWLLFIDFAILTDKAQSVRTDELTISVGRILLSDEEVPIEPLADWDIAVGVGLRLTGDMNGEGIQNDWHSLINQEPTVLPYEEADPETLGWVSGEWVWVANQDPEDWQWGVSMAFRGVVNSLGQSEWSPAAHIVMRHWSIDAWTGLRYESRNGNGSNTLAQQTVLASEEDAWLSAGIAPLRHINLNAGYNLESKESYGTIGFVVPIE